MALLRNVKIFYNVNCILVSIVNCIHLICSMFGTGQELVAAADLGYGLRIRKRRVKSDPDVCLFQTFFHQWRDNIQAEESRGPKICVHF
jgi:hypothetical protein